MMVYVCVSSTHVAAHKPPVPPIPGDLRPSSSLCVHASNTPIHIKIFHVTSYGTKSTVIWFIMNLFRAGEVTQQARDWSSSQIPHGGGKILIPYKLPTDLFLRARTHIQIHK